MDRDTTPSGYDFRYDDPLSPARAIREKCLECVGWETAEVRRCTATPDKCRLWPYRMGTGCDKEREAKPPSRTRAMRLECVEICMNGQPTFVKDCPSVGCAIWPYRMGRGICKDPSGNVIKPRRVVERSGEHMKAMLKASQNAREKLETGQDGDF